jgi:hypothetical protein
MPPRPVSVIHLWHVLRLLSKLIIWLTVISFLIDHLDPIYFAAASAANPIAVLDNPLESARNPFYGVSTAVPGTFARIIQKWYIEIIANSTTTAAITTPISTTASSVASGAAAVGTGTLIGAGARALILTVIYVTWMLASLITGGGA